MLSKRCYFISTKLHHRYRKWVRSTAFIRKTGNGGYDVDNSDRGNWCHTDVPLILSVSCTLYDWLEHSVTILLPNSNLPNPNIRSPCIRFLLFTKNAFQKTELENIYRLHRHPWHEPGNTTCFYKCATANNVEYNTW